MTEEVRLSHKLKEAVVSGSQASVKDALKDSEFNSGSHNAKNNLGNSENIITIIIF